MGKEGVKGNGNCGRKETEKGGKEGILGWVIDEDIEGRKMEK